MSIHYEKWRPGSVRSTKYCKRAIYIFLFLIFKITQNKNFYLYVYGYNKIGRNRYFHEVKIKKDSILLFNMTMVKVTKSKSLFLSVLVSTENKFYHISIYQKFISLYFLMNSNYVVIVTVGYCCTTNCSIKAFVDPINFALMSVNGNHNSGCKFT